MKRGVNGQGHIRQKADGRWEALYYVNGERRYITGRKGETAKEVGARLRAVLADLDKGIETPKDNRQTLGDYLDSWLITKKPTIEPTSWDRCEESFRLYVKPALGKVPLTKLTAQQIQQLYAQVLALGRAPGTVAKIHMALHKALEDALRLDMVPRNVSDLVDKPKDTHKEIQTLAPEQVVRLLEAAKGRRLEALIVLMFFTTCRFGELAGLRWSSLDLDRAEMRITAAMKERRGHMTLGVPKTPHSVRTIPLASYAVEALRRHHVAQTVERLKHGADWNPDALVFCTLAGTPINRNAFRQRVWKRLLERAGLPYVHPHALRHSGATFLYSMKVPPHAITSFLGHSNVAFTQSTYGHLQTAMLEDARKAMESLSARLEGAGDDA